MRGESFEARYRKSKSGCWLWVRSVLANGYGCLRRDGKTLYAHRVAWELYRGPIPIGLHVLHRCDVRRCVNPRHLFLGTNHDNIKDCRKKGRDVHARGEHAGKAKLNRFDVKAIRSLARMGYTQRAIGKKFGVSHASIGAVLRGEAWSHLK